MTLDAWILVISLLSLIGLLALLAAYYSRRARLLAADLAEVREAHAAAIRGVIVATAENAKLRRLRPLVLNGRIYYSYRVIPDSIYKN